MMIKGEILSKLIENLFSCFLSCEKSDNFFVIISIYS